ncbi:carboxymuconolactone decarboxylase family protein [Dyella solisilvae]|uniref:Carboxymuconolactone decarboxylase family protein n=1 Tax=Dyella solisilvae TaxID=1920168 RepID=A0A370K9L8_9GAMM|nr:carboxymuconolactone decarboxylase family protein [Dyella solisilvae]RDI99353.1 carboxymuconolactone decarboxylase family protein [Dyella solisilvae]
MSNFPIHTLKSAPEASKPALEGLQSAFGFVPNIAAAMATSPVLINSLVALFHQVHGDGKSFSEPQIETVLLTDAVTNGSTWAAAFHSYLAINKGVPATDVQAIRDGDLPKDPQFAALSRLAKTLIEKRGRLNTHDKDVFLQAGFSPNQLLEVVAIVAASTITNYTASITHPPLEENFQPHAWTAY